MRRSFAFVFVLVAACGAPTSTNPNDPPRVPADPNPVPDPAPQTQPVAVLLQGVGASEPVLVRVAAIALNVDGETLTAAPSDAEFDLAADTPWQVATFAVLQSASALAVTLQFQPEGTLVRDGAELRIDLRGPPISFAADVGQIQTNGRVVLELDIPGSLVDEEGALALLPHFTVAY